MNNPARLSMALAMDQAANASVSRRWPRAVVVKPVPAWLIWGVRSRSRRHAKYRQYGGVGFASCQVASVFFSIASLPRSQRPALDIGHGLTSCVQ